MNEYVLPFLASFALTALLTTPLRQYLVTHRIATPAPRQRDVHQFPIPRMGGLAVLTSFFLVVGVILAIAPEKLSFVSTTVLGVDRNLLGVLVGALILGVTGYVDDRYGLTPVAKLLGQLVAALVVVTSGVQIHWLSHPFGGPDITIGAWTWVLVPIWLLAMVNVMNWFDGLDGLASGLSGIAATAIFFLALDPIVSQPATALLAAIVAGAAFGFLPHNWHPARIFLGDTGSMFLGFMVGVFAIISGAKFATAALVLGIPIFDAVWVISRRILTGQPVWQADRKHLHHRLLDAGFSPKGAVLTLYAVAAAFAFVALNSQTEGKVAAFGILFALMVLFGIILVVTARRRLT